MTSIMALVKRDIVFATTIMKTQLIIAIILAIVFSLDGMKWALMTSIVVPYFLVYGQMAYEERDKSDKFVMALPVKRSDICFAKYITIAIYMIATALISLVIMKATNQELAYTFILQTVCLILGVGMAYTAIILPMILKWGVEKSRYVVFLSYIVVYMLLTIGTVQNEVLNKIPEINVFWGSLMVIGIYVISMCISLGIYKKKEFH